MKLFALIRLLDIATTFIAIHYFYADEANPLMRYMINLGWPYYLLFQFSVLAILMLLLNTIKVYKHFSIVYWTLIAVNALVVISNIFSIYMLW